MKTVFIANPLPKTLGHFVHELEETLNRIDVPSSTFPFMKVEGATSWLQKTHLLVNAVRNVRSIRGCSDTVITVWPSLGLLDARLLRNKRRNSLLIIHDPIPIRPQLGYGRISKLLTRKPVPASPIILSHSDDASAVLHDVLPGYLHLQLPHPIKSNQDTSRKMGAKERTVVVAGQFKPERNIKLLRDIGPRLQQIDAIGKIFGRGWPEIPGWEVESRFLSENELDGVLSAASAILIPYNRYYQSGIAIRALELGTMSISSPNSFAYDLLGPSGVVPTNDPDAWLRAIENVINSPELSATVFEQYRKKVDIAWKDFFDQNSETR